ncbi:multidrug effflux MFS transporter [Sporolactobacillus laevolacticus]|uniref:Bcr/CflA family efflux transporter n=1 Tax=Sporolactobacillus laevolacticus DSM 442 TaxID=1395513 RepID=V6IZP7_9BACL|nr:multidrug effflux MFS transporter [Sporolactobacillus laevolacticus]EST12316.1 MFS transporter [Sporolactobacillus laevolacticus DSM 442]
MKAVQTDLAAERQSRGAHVRFVLVLGALGAFGPLSMDMYLPSLPSLTKDLQTTTSQAQLSITACLIGLAAGQIILGPLSDKYGRKRPLLAGLITFTLVSFLCSITTSIGWLVLLRLIQGMAGAAGMVISRAIARDLYNGPKLTKFFSMLMAINGIFPILAPILGGFVLRFTSWHGIFVVLCVIGFLLFLGSLISIPETLPVEKRISGGLSATLSTMGSIFRDKQFVGFALVLGLVMGAMFCYISASSFVLQDMFNVSPQGFSLFFATNGFGIVVMSQLAGLLAGRVNARKILRTGIYIATIGSIALFASLLLNPPRLIAVIVPLFLVVSMVGLVNSTAFSLAMQTQEKAAGSASAILGLGMNTVGALLSPVVGIGGSHTYFPMALMILFCELSAFIIYLFFIRRKPLKIAK